MKKFTLLVFTISLSVGLFAQTTLFSEGFEGATNQFTTSAASSTTASWTLNTTLANTGINSFQGPVIISDTLWLESSAFSTVGFPTVNLSFSHICKVDFFDRALVQYSIDNGATWITANTTNYLGSASFIGNSFSSVSYLDWQPGAPAAIPTNSWWKTDQFNLPAASNLAQVKIRFTVIDSDNNGSLGNYGWVVDNVIVTGAPCELIPPVLTNGIDLSGLQYTTNPLAIGINATDASGIASVKAFYTINSGLLDSTVLSLSSGSRFTGTLSGFQIGDTVCYYYQAIDNTTCGNATLLPSSSCYQFIVRGAPPIPCVGVPNSVFPYSEDFSGFSPTAPLALINNWENVTTDDLDWRVNSGTTGSFGTGPTGDHTTGTGNYLYLETSGGFTNDEAQLITPCYDLTNISNGEFSFWYHMLGPNMGQLRIDIYANNQWNLDVIPPFIGNQGANWLNAVVDLSSYSGQVVKLRFRGIRGTSFTSDIALDDIELFNFLGDDAVVDSVSIASNITCQSSTPESISVVLRNFGTTTLTSIPLAYQIDNGTIVRDTFVGNLTPGNSQAFTFTQQATFVKTSSIFDVKAWSEVTADIRFSNDTTANSFTISPTVSSFPYTENFDLFTTGQPGTLLNGWINEPSNSINWNVNSGTTTTLGTGPTGDHTSGSGNYMYIQAFSGPINSEGQLITPCYDLTGLTNPEFTFWYHLFGQDIGVLHLDVYANNQWNLDVITPIIGDQGDNWFNEVANLSAYVGQTVKLRFRGTTSTGIRGDMAIDDIALIDVVGDDAALDSLAVTANSGCQTATPQPVSMVIRNFGTTTLTNIPLAYQVNNGTIVRQTFTGSIAPGVSQAFTFTQLATLTNPTGIFTIKCWVELTSDIRASNDSTEISIQRIPTVNGFPYTENFDTFITGQPGTLLNGWTNDQTDDLDWSVRSGTTPSTNTGPTQDQNSTGNGNYLYVETSGGQLGQVALLNSNCIDLAGATAPQLSFWYHMFGATMGEFHLDIIQNGVVTLDVITPIIGNQGNQWRNQTLNLTPYVGQVIQLRFRGIRGSSFTGDIAIDNIQITPAPPVVADVGISSLLNATPINCQPVATQSVAAIVENFSSSSSAITPVAYQLNNGAIVRDTLRSVLAPLSTTIFNFATPITLISGINELKVWTELTGDPVNTNDTITQVLQLNTVQTTFPVSENFDAFTVGTPGVFINGWENETILDTHDWYANSGTTPTAGTGPTADHTSGNGNYLYMNASGFSGTSARVLSRCYDLTNANAPELDFWYHMSGADMGTLHVDLDVNGFYVQDIIVPITGNQGSNWINRTIPLSGYPAVVRVIFRADVITKSGTITGDIAIDDVTINVSPVGLSENENNAVIGAIYPNPTTGLSLLEIIVKEQTEINTQLIDMNGRVVSESKSQLATGKNTVQIDASNLEKGVYFYRLIMNDEVVTKRIVLR